MPRLVIRKGVAAGRDHALGGPCTVGRHPDTDFVLDDQGVSRKHYCVFQQGAVWLVEDLGSTNGTQVNGQKVARQPLLDGDLIRAGSTEVQFVQKDILAQAAGGAAASRKRGGPGDAPVARRRRRR